MGRLSEPEGSNQQSCAMPITLLSPMRNQAYRPLRNATRLGLRCRDTPLNCALISHKEVGQNLMMRP
jgi:hypothetical protein